MPGLHAQNINLELFIGTDKQFTFTVRDEDGNLFVAPAMDFSWRLKRRLSDQDSATVLLKTTAAGGISVSGSDVTVTITDTDTQDFVARPDYRHELKRVVEGSEGIAVYGLLNLIRGVHRT